MSNLYGKLHSHRGGLVRLRTDLFWYGPKGVHPGSDGVQGRVCLLLDTRAPATSMQNAEARTTLTLWLRGPEVLALLMIEGRPRWVIVEETTVEVIDDPA